jgi:thiol-disulfide isomerase/thioredoxin
MPPHDRAPSSRSLRWLAATITTLALAAPVASLAKPANYTGAWEGVLTTDNGPIRFAFEIKRSGDGFRGSFFNGDERVSSTHGSALDGKLSLDFEHYATHLDATADGDTLRGTYGNALVGVRPIELHKRAGRESFDAAAPTIFGLWTLPIESPKGEHAFRLILRQKAGEISAAILRVDGDTGLLTGGYRDGRFILDHFDGGRGYHLEIIPAADGSLELSLFGIRNAVQHFVAVRPESSTVQPSEFTAHTRWKDPAKPFEFSFPDVSGRPVSSHDPRFAGKVLLVNITGSWCPNCHDEAPYLEALYKRYRALGLEVVALDFEEPEQLSRRSRLAAFIKHYGIEYQYLVAGEPKELAERLPDSERLNAWPTTFFVDRTGHVREIHTGFAGRASGEFYAKQDREFTTTIERLLAE